ncbi:MAG: nucleoside:proton symporter [Betaproteobacteria bacterium]|nr:nucleoside:proton symporter [Betaproteobacteria bacterium]
MPPALQSLIGFILLFAFAFAISEKRGSIIWRTVFGAIILQIVMFVLLFKFPWFKEASAALNDALNGVAAATREGTKFVFGYLGATGSPADAPFKVEEGRSTFIAMTMALPVIIVVSALSSLLFYWRILPVIVTAFSWALKKTIGVGGAVGVSTAANIFLGTVEAPLFIRPYLAKLSRGELFITMAGGMAGVAGTVMVLYGIILSAVVPDAIGHVLIVSFISAPAAVAFSALMVPHEGPGTEGGIPTTNPTSSVMDAVTQGTVDGVAVYINVAAMLIVLTALIALSNMILGLPFAKDVAPTLQGILGWIMRPVVWLIGIPWNEAQAAGSLMGTKTVLNEFIAFFDLAKLSPDALSVRSRVIMVYALCGFANFASIGIMIGGLGTICPERRADIIDLGYKSLVAGSLATLSCGALVGIIY